ncbi:hypothetical protein [Deinococcus planocerae]|uniref:hypothetical protein n=1 Tax=Deinococcus planocerae TaxID=1737569 RepID=UPI0011AECBF3|nr:hypothetical protein [Deinococcus planocerae]
MKRLQLSGAMLGLTVLLGACTGGPTTPPTTHSLTLKLDGVTSAPVTVTNTTTNTQVFGGTLEGSKTFAGLKTGDVFRVEGGAVNGYTAPAAQSVTLSADKTVTLAYVQAGRLLNPSVISGRITGTDLRLAKAYLGSASDPFYGGVEIGADHSLQLDLSNLTPGAPHLSSDEFVTDCQGENSNPAARILWNETMNAYGPQGDLLGRVTEQVTEGADSALPNARIVRLYSDSDFTFTGTCTYLTRSGTLTQETDISVKRGWNALVLSGDSTRQGVRNAAPNDRVELSFVAEAPRVGVRLTPGELTFTDDSVLTVQAKVTQVGGYRGTVTLTTDVPGLTVEPSTLTLPALAGLGAQATSGGKRALEGLSLAPQQVETALKFRYTGTDNVSARPFTLVVRNSAGEQVGSGTGTLKVSRPGINVFVNTSGFQVTPGGTGQLPVSVFSVGGFSGAVTVRLENLPQGVSANTRTVTLDANGSAGGDLTLTGGASLTPGEYEATLIAEGNGRSARTSLKIVVPKPTVTVRVETYSGVSVYQGETGSVRVSVSGDFGFSGSTTLTLTGLPTGVTASPVTVQVTPGATTTVEFPLNASADAPAGVSTVRVTSPDSANWGSPDTFQLSVRPGRVVLPTDASDLAPAAQGIWVMGSGTYDASSGTYRASLTRYHNGVAVTSVSLPSPGGDLLALPAGDVLVSGAYGSGNVSRVDDAGTVTPLTAPGDIGGGAMDGQGRVWYVRRASTGMGGMKTTLERWDPATGANVVVDDTRDYGYGQGRLVASNNGTYLAYLPTYSGSAVSINTASETVTTLSPAPSGQSSSLAISDTGAVWYSEYGRLTRVNADGTTTTFDDPASVTALIGFDRATPHVLWASSSSNVLKIDTAGGSPTVTIFPLGNPSRGVTLRDGGVAVTFNESMSGTSRSSLSVLR